MKISVFFYLKIFSLGGEIFYKFGQAGFRNVYALKNKKIISECCLL